MLRLRFGGEGSQPGFAFIDAVNAQPHHLQTSPGPRHLTLLRELCDEADASGDLMPDAVVAAIAVEHHCDVVTLDRDFARFTSVRHIRPRVWCRPGAGYTSGRPVLIRRSRSHSSTLNGNRRTTRGIRWFTVRSTAISRSKRRCLAASHGNRISSRNRCGRNPLVISSPGLSANLCSGPGNVIPRIRPTAIG